MKTIKKKSSKSSKVSSKQKTKQSLSVKSETEIKITTPAELSDKSSILASLGEELLVIQPKTETKARQVASMLVANNMDDLEGHPEFILNRRAAYLTRVFFIGNATEKELERAVWWFNTPAKQIVAMDAIKLEKFGCYEQYLTNGKEIDMAKAKTRAKTKNGKGTGRGRVSVIRVALIEAFKKNKKTTYEQAKKIVLKLKPKADYHPILHRRYWKIAQELGAIPKNAKPDMKGEESYKPPKNPITRKKSKKADSKTDSKAAKPKPKAKKTTKKKSSKKKK